MNPIFISFIVSALFAGNVILSKLVTNQFSVIFLSFLRLLFSFITLIFFESLRINFKKITNKDFLLFLFLALVLVIINLTFFTGLKFQASTNYAIITASAPLLTAFFAALIFKSKLTKRFIISLILSFIGIILIITQGKLDCFKCLHKGEFLAITNTVFWVVYNLTVKMLAKKYSGIFINFLTSLVGGIILLPFLYFINLNWSAFNLISITQILYIGIIGTGIGFSMYSYSIKKIGPGKASFVSFGLVPVWVALISTIALNDPITIWDICGGILVIIGLALGLLN